MTPELIWMLALLAAVGAACFYAGWRSAAAYMTSANTVVEMAKEAQADRKAFENAVDNAVGSTARLAQIVQAHTETTSAKLTGLENALTLLFEGFERAGIARRETRKAAVGPQHGETAAG